MPGENKPLNIVIAGASGFVGRSLIKDLLQTTNHQIIALSRSDKSSESTPRLLWKKCDLFSLKDIQRALEECDVAIYLVHSMLPSARLSQGNFSDYDLILADNFVRAARSEKIKQIIYLGGIIPDDLKISEHLRSRIEVEKTLGASEIPLTALRAGVVLGPSGSSFTMMLNLVKRLPAMICPSWTSTLSNPIAIWDVIQAIKYCMANPITYEQHFDIGGADTVSYRDMMKVLADLLKVKRFFVSVPLFSPKLSKLWVSLFSGAPKELVYPLVESLKTHMVPDINHRLDIPGYQWSRFKDALARILQDFKSIVKRPNAFSFTGNNKEENEVRSIQRLQTLFRFNAEEVATIYFQWLPSFLKPLVRVKCSGGVYLFYFFYIPKPALILEHSPERSSRERQLFYIRGGYLAHGEGRGRLEFRNMIDYRYTIAAIHEFRPKLPWYIYKYTQALIHLWAMRSFNNHLIGLRKDEGLEVRSK